MDWPMLLAKYPQPILEDETPLFVLSFIEKAGIITESDLHSSFGKISQTLNSVLVKLHLNELVEYDSNSVRATTRGSNILHQFGLTSGILLSVLDDCGVRASDRKQYLLILDAYRKSSQRLYQNSLCSLRQWKQFSNKLPIPNSELNATKSKQAGFCLVLRDIINWLTLSSAASLALNTDELKIAASTIQDLWHSVNLDVSHSTNRDLHKRYLRFLVKSEDLSAKTYKKNESTPSVETYLKYYHYFQATHAPDDWFTHWSRDLQPPELKNLKFTANYLRKLVKKLGIQKDENASSTSHWNLFLRNWSPASYISLDSENLLTSLLCSRSISDMSDRTGVSKEVIPKVIEDIRLACNRLLQAEQENADQSPTGVAIRNENHSSCDIFPKSRTALGRRKAR